VTSLVVLHAGGDAPQIRLESGHPRQLVTQLGIIVRQLEASPTTDCWTSDSCFNGMWIEADDATGVPFLGLPYPYPNA
jgi:hypothetical protein